MLPEIVIAVFVLIFVRYFIKWWYDPLRCIPGPRGLPFIGNLLDFYLHPDSNELILRWVKQHGPIFKYRSALSGWTVLVADLASAKHILVTNSSSYKRSEFLKTFLPALGSSLINTNGKIHANQRKHLNPEFTHARMQRYLPTINSKTKELIKFWKGKIIMNNGKPIEEEVLEKFTNLTLDVIGLCSCGYSFDCISGGHQEESRAANKILTASFNIMRKSIESSFPFMKIFPSKDRTELENAEKVFYGLIDKVIKVRQRMHDSSTEVKSDWLESLFEMHQHLDKETAKKRIFENVLLFMIAGHETTSTALTWMIYCLAKHPKLQEKVRTEVCQVIENSAEIHWEDIEHLKYLDCFIKETLRLYPPGTSVSRECIKEDKIGKYVITPGTTIYVSISSFQRDDQFWKDPDEFDPERFMSIDSSVRNKDATYPYCFMPFSRGSRMCIGYRFAQMELKVVSALLLNSFSFKLGSNQPESIESREKLTLKPFPSLIIEISSLK